MTTPMTLGDRYRLEEVIGRGGMAEVWRATDTRLGREVAIKRLRVDLAGDPTFQARFQREAQSAAGLNHPNIVSVYDTGTQVDPATGVAVPYIVMELVHGRTLRDILQDGRKILPSKAFEFTAGVLDALAYSHRRGIIHRDIKPANVMLTNTGQIKVMDFGIARPMDTSQATMTQTAAVIGTAQYLSPEQARGETVDARSDIYSVGCMLYELLTGRPPFIGESPVVVAVMHVRENPVPPSQLDPEVTGQMDAIVLTALAKDPGDRYQSAQEMRDDIARLLHGQQIEATVPVVPVAPPVATGTQVLSPTMAASLDESGARRLLDTDTGIGAAFSEEEEDDAPPPVDPNQKKKISRVAVILVSLLIVVAAVIGFIIYRAMQPQEIPQTTVPNVTNMLQDDAKSALDKVGLKYEITTKQVDDKNQADKVIEQDPKGETQVPPGSKVKLVVAIGPDSAEIPTVTGKTQYEAEQILKDAGWKKTKFADAVDEPIDMKEGQVVNTNPEAGQKVSFDQEITINVATGQSKIPDVRGKSSNDAQQIARENGFSIDTGATTFENSDTVAAGVVIDQNPAPGEKRYRDTTITIVVSNGPKPPPTTVPPTSPPTQEPTSKPTETTDPAKPTDGPTAQGHG